MTEKLPVPAHPNALALVETLWEAGMLTPTHLDLEKVTSYDLFEGIGAWLGTVRRSGQWWTGDWINHGERNYGERMAQAAEATGLSPQSLLNVASICRRIPPAVRRPNVPFHVHAEVASLTPAEQDRWLKHTEEHGWSREKLRDELRASKAQPVLETPQVLPSLEEAARSIFDTARQYGPDGYVVTRDAFQTLAVALGEEI